MQSDELKELRVSIDLLTSEIAKFCRSLGFDQTPEQLQQLPLLKEWSQTPMGHLLAKLQHEINEVREKAEEAQSTADETHALVEQIQSEIEE